MFFLASLIERIPSLSDAHSPVPTHLFPNTVRGNSYKPIYFSGFLLSCFAYGGLF